jgi:hypothetical protein
MAIRRAPSSGREKALALTVVEFDVSRNQELHAV